MRIVFMGTPDFASETLLALHKAGHEIIAAVSQPDKPVGRHGDPKPTAVKQTAQELGIPVMQPEKASDPQFIEELKALQPEVIVVTAYGKLLKKELLDIPKYGCINVHASLLPRWRGAAPIQWALIEGDEKTGVTTQLMNEGLDTGDILMMAEIVPDAEETGGTLFDKLSILGGELIVDTLKALEAGTLTRTPQSEEGMTYAKILTKDMGNIDWEKDAVSIERLMRGLYPWPGSFTKCNGKLLKFHKGALPNEEEEAEIAAAKAALCEEQKEAGAMITEEGLTPGTVILCDDRLYVQCGEGVLRILELQPEGKKRMAAADYLRGYKPESFERA